MAHLWSGRRCYQMSPTVKPSGNGSLRIEDLLGEAGDPGRAGELAARPPSRARRADGRLLDRRPVNTVPRMPSWTKASSRPSWPLRVQHRHLRAGARAARRAVDGAGPGRRASQSSVPVETVTALRREIRRRAAAPRAGDGEPVKPGCSGWTTGSCSRGGGLDHLADARDVAALVGRQPQAERLGVGDDVEHAAVRDVDGHRAEVRHLDRARRGGRRRPARS